MPPFKNAKMPGMSVKNIPTFLIPTGVHQTRRGALVCGVLVCGRSSTEIAPYQSGSWHRPGTLALCHSLQCRYDRKPALLPTFGKEVAEETASALSEKACQQSTPQSRSAS